MVTEYMKLRGGKHRAVTKVKGLSAEILENLEADTVHIVAGRNSVIGKARLQKSNGV